jgi:hypothetical protein
MKITTYESPHVRIIEDFVSKEDCDWFVNYVTEQNLWSFNNADPAAFPDGKDYELVSKQWDNRKVELNSLYSSKTHPELFKRAYPVMRSAKEQVSDLFGVTQDSFQLESWEAVRWYAPFHQGPHIDYIDADFDRSALPEGYDSSFFTKDEEDLYRRHCTTKNYTGMIYMNDDFEGGELFFPYHDNFQIKPKPGMLVMFSGNIFNPHGIREITSGTRYVHTTFWTKSSLSRFPVGYHDNQGTLDKFWE